jgi:serine/threonine protein kinase
MAEARRCPQCGAALAADAPEGLCPQCLLNVGLPTGAETGEATTMASPHPGSFGLGDRSQANSRHLPEVGRKYGAYRLVRLLGKGGMGAVYEAEHLETGRRVALKVLGHSLDSPEARARFLREGRLAASINHPNSVYIYGTEEIEGTPVIAMELVAGGTLQDQVRQEGPLPVTGAVDAILQIIAGLEAAQAAGVLHRDIKPSNCFVDAEGTVKVGDFGLSISTAGRGEANLTITGSFLGTPSFSSPEQLRGDELNVRSDVYSVGVTLYYLLTGRAPFEAGNLVRLLATVLERPAESPAKWRREIPKGLTRVVLRCLEKQPAQRFKDYDELRRALLPFDSTAPTPGTLGLRFLAGAIDILVWNLALISVQLLVVPRSSWLTSPLAFRGRHTHVVLSVTGFILSILYYAVLEGVWGATLGKALCRLRVVGPNRSAPGVPKALLRAVIIVALPALPYCILFGLDPTGGVAFTGKVDWFHLLTAYSYWAVLALIFSTARRRNGFAGLHDLLSSTRVIRKPVFHARPALRGEAEAPPTTEATPEIGPYHVLHSLDKIDAGELLVGYDARLLRKVWLRKLPNAAPPVAAVTRGLGRPGRLRWLGGKRSANECWDAYEYVSGEPLGNLLDQRRPWRSVRYWLLDLAAELNAGLKEQSLPAVLGLDRVWITADGRAKLLDFPAPGIREQSALSESRSPAEGDFAAARLFVNQVAVAALEGRVIDAEAARSGAPAVPLPLHARNFLNELPTSQSFERLVAGLKPLLGKVASVSRLRRFALILGCALFPMVMTAVLLFGQLVLRQWGKENAEIKSLRRCLARLEKLEEAPLRKVEEVPPEVSATTQPSRLQPLETSETQPIRRSRAEQRRAFEIYIAGRFRETITDPAVWSSPYATIVILQPWRNVAEEIVARHPDPSEEELREATALVKPLIEEDKLSDPFEKALSPAVVLLCAVIGLVIYVVIPSLICALLFRGGLLLRILGLAIVTRRGSGASRLRVFWRTLITWSPVALLAILCVLLVPFAEMAWAVSLGLAPWLALVIWSALLPQRSLQDRIAGTWLVPR